MRPLGSVTVPPVTSGNYRVAIGDLGVAVGSWPYGRPADPDHIDVLRFDGTSRGFDVRGGLGAVMAYGPGDVVYTMNAQDGSANDFALAAIAIAGDRAGTVVASTPASIIEFTEVPPAVFGHGQAGLVRRDRDFRPTVLNYVDIAGKPVAPQQAEPSFTSVNDPSEKFPQTRIASSSGDVWNLEIESSPDRATEYSSASPPGPTSDGAGVFWTDVGPAVETSGLINVPTMWVIAQLKSGGTTTWWSVPDGWQVVATDVGGTVLAKQTDTRLELAIAFTQPATIRPTTQTTTSQQPIVRPYVDPTICNPLTATESTYSDDTWVPFARPSAEPLPIQAIGDPSLGPTGPFAVVLRYPNQDHTDQVGDLVNINGWAVGMHTFENGNGEAIWNLSDGTQGYLRSRGLDTTTLASIVARLTQRDRSAPVPGFDYAGSPNGPAHLELIAEHINAGLTGSSATIRCRVETTAFIYTITTIDADPVTRFMSVIDSPPPLEVAAAAGRLIVIIGNADAKAPTAAQVSNADPATWSNLVAQPPP